MKLTYTDEQTGVDLMYHEGTLTITHRFTLASPKTIEIGDGASLCIERHIQSADWLQPVAKYNEFARKTKRLFGAVLGISSLIGVIVGPLRLLWLPFLLLALAIFHLHRLGGYFSLAPTVILTPRAHAEPVMLYQADRRHGDEYRILKDVSNLLGIPVHL